MINAAAPDLLISIHHDSVQPIYLSEWTWKGAPALFCAIIPGLFDFHL